MMSDLCSEAKRVKFVADRDGEEAARAFCRQTLKAYRIELKRLPNHPFRRGLIHSCIVFRRYLRGESFPA